MNNLQEDGWDLSDLKHIDLPPAEAQTYRLESGDILFNRTNSKELVGKCAVFRERGHWVFASYLIRVRVDSRSVLPEFVANFLNARAGRVQIDRVSRQIIGMSNINAEEIRALRIPLPPLSVQGALVEAMSAAYRERDKKLAQADALLRDLDAYLLDQLSLAPPSDDKRQVFAVRLGQMLSGERLDADYFHPERMKAIREQENRTGLRAERLASIARFIRETVAASASENYVGLANVQSHTGELVASNEEDLRGQCFRFMKGDILFARLRPYLNKVYRAEENGVCSTEFHVIRVGSTVKSEEEILPDYLATILRSSLVLVQTRHMMTGNTHPRLANHEVVNLVVPIPELGVQRAITVEVRRRRQEARLLRKEAMAGWEAAKAQFAEKLLGKASDT